MTDFPPGNILFSYDFSTRCREAWASTRELARRFGATMEAVHVRDWLSPAGTRVRDSLTPSVKERLEAAMAEQLAGAPSAGCRVIEGAEVEGILSAARRGGADLLVVASDRRGAAGGLTLGSTCDELARESPVPVLTLRGPMAAVRSVFAPADLTHFSEKAAELAARAAAALGARLTLLNASPGGFAQRSASARLERFLASLPEPLRAAARPSVSVVDASSARRIAERAEDAIVVIEAPREPAVRGTLGATAELLLRFSGAAVLTVPAGAAL